MIPMPGTLAVNGYTFTTDSGFPTTGFTGATFQLLINGSASNNSNYDWSCDQTWLTVDSAGNVTFLTKPLATTKTVHILARSRSGGDNYVYTFTLDSWFINNGGTGLNWHEAHTWAQSQGGSLATVQQLNGSTSHENGVRGTLGALWSEWGDMSTFSDSGFVYGYYWTSEAYDKDSHYYVSLSYGQVNDISDIVRIVMCVCQQSF